jgi:hypothetical protein
MSPKKKEKHVAPQKKKKKKNNAVAAAEIDKKRAADRHKVQCRKRPSGRYARGTRKGTWAQTEIEFNMAVATKDALIQGKDSEINAKDAEIKARDAELEAQQTEIVDLERKLMGANMQLAASRAVALGWKAKWRRDNPSAPSNSESSDESWEP